MKVEIFEDYEVQSIAEDLERFKELAEKLNLDGQKTVVEDGTKLIPFKEVSPRELRAIRAYLGSFNSIEKFDYSPIPVRVLEVLSEWKHVFDQVIVFYSDNSEKVDPIAVGKIERDGKLKYYLIARWGEELIPYDELIQKGIETIKRNLKTTFTKAKVDAEKILENIDFYVEEALKGRYISITTDWYHLNI